MLPAEVSSPELFLVCRGRMLSLAIQSRCLTANPVVSAFVTVNLVVRGEHAGGVVWPYRLGPTGSSRTSRCRPWMPQATVGGIPCWTARRPGSRTWFGTAVSVVEGFASLPGLVRVGDDRTARRLRVVAGAGSSRAHGLRPRRGGCRLLALLAVLARRFARAPPCSGLLRAPRGWLGRGHRRPCRRLDPAVRCRSVRSDASGLRQRRVGLRAGGAPEAVRLANVRWLSRYRHPRCLQRPVAARLLEIFSQPGPLMPGADAAGDRLGRCPCCST